jgi:hypothetical protein
LPKKYSWPSISTTMPSVSVERWNGTARVGLTPGRSRTSEATCLSTNRLITSGPGIVSPSTWTRIAGAGCGSRAVTSPGMASALQVRSARATEAARAIGISATSEWVTFMSLLGVEWRGELQAPFLARAGVREPGAVAASAAVDMGGVRWSLDWTPR